MFKKYLFLAVLLFSVFGVLTTCLWFFWEIVDAIPIIPYYILQPFLVLGWLASAVLAVISLVQAFAFDRILKSRIEQLTKRLEFYERSYHDAARLNESKAALKWSDKIAVASTRLQKLHGELAKLSEKG
ncbi:MAG: hypothetical protein JW839_15785 [Candidatus Lokiarchaeota archaeon]|nr:hypothetical protein [Candidatus Lokiarchaeota archaeon]